jgi:hypothetical protein
MAVKTSDNTITIPEIQKRTLKVNVLGIRPLICNRMSKKARETLLVPKPKMNQAEKQANQKHNPLTEYRASPYIMHDDSAPTYLAVMSSAFKGAMATAALDLPGTKKAQIGRLVYVEGDYTPIYGMPKLLMSVVRMADISHTPDIRTRLIIPRWAARVEVTFVQPILNVQSIINLMSAAGTTACIGDWRVEKGKGDYGQFQVVNDDDPTFLSILAEGGRAAQLAAWTTPEPYDEESAEMLEYWGAEFKRRGLAAKDEPEEETEEVEADA